MKWRKSGKRTAPSCWMRSQGVMKGRFIASCSTVATKSRSLSMVGRRRTGVLMSCSYGSAAGEPPQREGGQRLQCGDHLERPPGGLELLAHPLDGPGPEPAFVQLAADHRFRGQAARRGELAVDLRDVVPPDPAQEP